MFAFVIAMLLGSSLAHAQCLSDLDEALPRPGGRADMKLILYRTGNAQVFRTNDNGTVETSIVSRADVSKVCPACITYDNYRFFESHWTVQNYLPLVCGSDRPKTKPQFESLSVELCGEMGEWLKRESAKQKVKPVPLGTLQRLFNYMRNQPIPFEYSEDGCYSRADLMAAMLEAFGIESRKILIVNRDKRFETTNRWTRERVPWWYHVAPLIEVRLPNGQIAKRVFDPSMETHLMSPDEWSGAISPDPCKFVEVSATLAQKGCFLLDAPSYVSAPNDESEKPGSQVVWAHADLPAERAVAQGFLPEALRRRKMGRMETMPPQ